MRANALNLLQHIVLQLYILSLQKAEKEFSQVRDFNERVPSILKEILITRKHGTLTDVMFH